MLRKIVVFATMAVLSACASSRGVAPPAPTVPEVPKGEVQEAPQAPPQTPADPQGEKRLKFGIKMPDASWIKLPDEQVQNGAEMVFLNEEKQAVVQLFFQREPGSDANKVTQVIALMLVLNGVQPIDLLPSEDGTSAELTATMMSENGQFLAYVSVRRSTVDPDLYVLVNCLWKGETISPEDLALFRGIADSITLSYE